jgi:hypothetical protein
MSQFQSPSSRSRGSGYAVGVLCMLMGALVIAIAFGLIHTDPSKIHAPRWLLTIFGATFFVAGVWAIFQRAVSPGTARAGRVNFLFGLFLMLAFSVICLWIGFGPGERLFVRAVGTGIDPDTVPVDPTAGRIFFGAFGVLMSGVTVAFALTRGRKLLRPRGEDDPNPPAGES